VQPVAPTSAVACISTINANVAANADAITDIARIVVVDITSVGARSTEAAGVGVSTCVAEDAARVSTIVA
jgi:hypothetical protein